MSANVSFHNVVRVDVKRTVSGPAEHRWTVLEVTTKDYPYTDETMTEVVFFGYDGKEVPISMPPEVTNVG